MSKFNKAPFQQWIAQGETKTAIAQLVKISSTLRPESVQTEITHLSARWSEYERQDRMGIKSPEQLGLTKRQIDQSLLQLLERIAEVNATTTLRQFWKRFAAAVAVLSGIVTIVGVTLKDVIHFGNPPIEQVDTLPKIDTVKLEPLVTTIIESTKSGKTSTPPTQPSVVEKTNNTNPLVEQFDNGKIDWQNQYIESTGIAIINTEKYKNRTQAIELAKIGAKRVAQANLLDIIQAVKVTRTTTVQDFMTTSDNINSQIQGTIRGARTVGAAVVKEDQVTVTVRMSLYATNGLSGIIQTEIQKNPTPFQSFDLTDTTGASPQLLKKH